MKIKWKQLRKRAGLSQERVAVAAGVTSPTVRVFEAGGPEAISDEHKRASLVATYRGLENGEAG